MRNKNLLKSRVSDIPVKQIRFNQGVGVLSSEQYYSANICLKFWFLATNTEDTAVRKINVHIYLKLLYYVNLILAVVSAKQNYAGE